MRSFLVVSWKQDTNTIISAKPTPGISATTTLTLNNLNDLRTSASINTTNLSTSITTNTLQQKGIHLLSHCSWNQMAVVTSHPTICFNVVIDQKRAQQVLCFMPGITHARPESLLPGCKLLFLVTVTFLLSSTPFWVVHILKSTDSQKPLYQFCSQTNHLCLF